MEVNVNVVGSLGVAVGGVKVYNLLDPSAVECKLVIFVLAVKKLAVIAVVLTRLVLAVTPSNVPAAVPTEKPIE